jgi:hypothetical protein
MGALRHYIRRNRAAFAWVMALTIAVRALMPVGWMPSATAGQVISICTGDGVSAAVIGADGKIHKSDPAKADHKDSPCTFAGTGLALAKLAAAIPALTLPPLVEESAVFSEQQSPGRGLAAPPPPKTGPPALI